MKLNIEVEKVANGYVVVFDGSTSPDRRFICNDVFALLTLIEAQFPKTHETTGYVENAVFVEKPIGPLVPRLPPFKINTSDLDVEDDPF